ncbi:MAG: TetR/AcrR family transcriptional regulator [Stackebrandtia sp.]
MATQQSGADRRRRTRMSAADRRESLLTVAVDVFAEFGYQQAKTSMVAARLGVSEPVVFQNFGNKAALFAAVIHRATDQACGIVAYAMEQRIPVRKLLALVLDPRYLEQAHAAGSIGAIFANATAVTGEPVIAAAARKSTRRFAAALIELLEQGKAAGELRSDLDAEAAAWWLLSVLSSQPFRRATAADPSDIEARLSRLTFDLLTGGEN